MRLRRQARSSDRPALFPFAHDTHREREGEGKGDPPKRRTELEVLRTLNNHCDVVREGEARGNPRTTVLLDTHICKPRGQQEDTRAPARPSFEAEEFLDHGLGLRRLEQDRTDLWRFRRASARGTGERRGGS